MYEIKTFIRFKKRVFGKLSFVLSCRQNVCITSDNPVSSSHELTSSVNSPDSCDGLGKRVRKLSNKYDGFEQPNSVLKFISFTIPSFTLYISVNAILICLAGRDIM